MYTVRVEFKGRAIIEKGQLVVPNLPFAEGQAVRFVVCEDGPSPKQKKAPIAWVRQQLAGSVSHFEDPTEPMIPPDSWEMLK
jgi:hypothetical protein